MQYCTLLFQASGMAPGAESCGENLADRRVKVWCPREES